MSDIKLRDLVIVNEDYGRWIAPFYATVIIVSDKQDKFVIRVIDPSEASPRMQRVFKVDAKSCELVVPRSKSKEDEISMMKKDLLEIIKSNKPFKHKVFDIEDYLTN